MSILDITLATGYRDWMEGAFCHQMPADMWHPEDAEGAWTAKKLCKERCPVIEACLRHALDNDETEGIWGGTTPSERRGASPVRRACARNHPGEAEDSYPTSKGLRCRACERVRTRMRRAAIQQRLKGQAA